MHTEVTPIGSIMRDARKAKGWSQEELAEYIGVAKKTILAVENNKRFPSFDVLWKLVHALDISSDLILCPDRVLLTGELDQLINELRACNEREQRFVTEMIRGLLRALRHDEPEKQD